MSGKKPERQSAIRIEQLGPESFALTVTFGDREFACGSYLNRAAAAQAGKLFIERKEGEEAGRRKRPRGK